MGDNQAAPFNRTVIVGVLLSAAFLTILNQTLLLTAVPPIMSELHIDANQAQWLTTAFLLTNGVLIPVTAFLIERFSSRSLLIAALLIFAAGTLLGALAPSFSFLLAARVIQAGGAGIMMPLMQTVMLTIYPPERRGAAMGMTGLVIAFAPAIGPSLSGWIIDHFSWRHLFYLVFPLAVAVLIAAVFLMKNVTAQQEAKVHVPSIILSTLGWGGLLYGFSMVGRDGWSDPAVIGSLLAGSISLALFIRLQLRMDRPLLEFRVFCFRIFTLTTLLSVVGFALMIGAETLMPLYAQHVRGFTALESGALMLPGAILNGIMSPISGRIFDRVGGRGLTIGGFALIVLSMVLFLNIGMSTSLLYIAGAFALMMTGISMSMMPLMTAGMNALPPHLIPHGTAMGNTIRMVGGSIGTALLVSVMSSVAERHGATGSSFALLDGILAGFAVSGALAAIGLLLTFAMGKEKKEKRQAAAGR